MAMKGKQSLNFSLGFCMQVRFLFEEARIVADQTPEDLEMEDGDVIDMYMLTKLEVQGFLSLNEGN